jgi:hypothetical protein
MNGDVVSWFMAGCPPRPTTRVDEKPTLAEVGIDKNLADRARTAEPEMIKSARPKRKRKPTLAGIARQATRAGIEVGRYGSPGRHHRRRYSLWSWQKPHLSSHGWRASRRRTGRR